LIILQCHIYSNKGKPCFIRLKIKMFICMELKIRKVAFNDIMHWQIDTSKFRRLFNAANILTISRVVKVKDYKLLKAKHNSYVSIPFEIDAIRWLFKKSYLVSIVHTLFPS